MRNATLEKLSWVSIYAGLLTASLGVFVHDHSTAAGLTLIIAGGLAAAFGVVLILIRARRRPD